MSATWRIGISGGPGIGKSLLARGLAEEMGFPLVGEGVREWLAQRGGLPPSTLDFAAKVRLQRWFLARKLWYESRLSHFRSDRTVIDGIVITRMRLGSSCSDRVLAELIARGMEHAKARYQLLAIPPFSFYGDRDPIRTRSIEDRRAEHRAIVEAAEGNGLPILHLSGSHLRGWIAEVGAFCC